MRNSSRRRSGTNLPDPSLTVTGTTTWLTEKVILPCLLGWTGVCWFCSGADGVGFVAGTVRRVGKQHSGQQDADDGRFLVDFHGLKPSFAVQILERVSWPRIHQSASRHPTVHQHPRGALSGRASLAEESIHAFHA